MKYLFEARHIIDADSLEEARAKLLKDTTSNPYNEILSHGGEEIEEGTEFVRMVDSLDSRAQDVKDEVAQDFIDWLKENNLPDDFDEYYQDRGADMVSEFADSSTPIHYSDIDAIHYLRGNDVQEAYSDAGIGDGTEDNQKQVAIYCYLSNAGHEGLRELEDLLEEHKEEGKAKLIEAIKEEYSL